MSNPKNHPDPAAPVDPGEQDTSNTPTPETDSQMPDDTSTTSPWIKPKTA